MATVIEGDFATPAGRFAVVAARFNATVVDALLAGALDAFRRHGVADDAVDLVRVPGSFEISVVARRWRGTLKRAGVRRLPSPSCARRSCSHGAGSRARSCPAASCTAPFSR